MTAPAAGVVTKIDAQPGAMVPAGTPLATIASSQGLQARVGIEPSDAAAVKAGQKVSADRG